jgi:hypothetical protein
MMAPEPFVKKSRAVLSNIVTGGATDTQMGFRATTQDRIKQIYTSQSNLVIEKNKRYGNAALEPLGVFCKHIKTENSESLNGILVRLDDKLKRVKHGDEIRKNDVSDLMGYLALLCIEKGWDNFDDLID